MSCKTKAPGRDGDAGQARECLSERIGTLEIDDRRHAANTLRLVLNGIKAGVFTSERIRLFMNLACASPEGLHLDGRDLDLARQLASLGMPILFGGSNMAIGVWAVVDLEGEIEARHD